MAVPPRSGLLSLSLVSMYAHLAWSAAPIPLHTISLQETMEEPEDFPGEAAIYNHFEAQFRHAMRFDPEFDASLHAEDLGNGDAEFAGSAASPAFDARPEINSTAATLDADLRRLAALTPEGGMHKVFLHLGAPMATGSDWHNVTYIGFLVWLPRGGSPLSHRPIDRTRALVHRPL